MKKILFFILIAWNNNAFGQSVILNDPFQNASSNLSFYYKNACQVIDHLRNIRNNVKYYTERTLSIYVF
ncbi:MAG TPA: hypothetical protein VLZ83_10885 [Edaphocola sp.]|nr:hypothetical protein [Edaphocola sp.]